MIFSVFLLLQSWAPLLSGSSRRMHAFYGIHLPWSGTRKKEEDSVYLTPYLLINSCNFVTISQYVYRTSLRVLIVTLSRTKINENKAVVAAQAPQSALQIHVAPFSFRRIHVPRHSRSAAFVCRTTHVSTHSCVAPLTFGGVHVSSHTHFAAFMCHPMTAD